VKSSDLGGATDHHFNYRAGQKKLEQFRHILPHQVRKRVNRAFLSVQLKMNAVTARALYKAGLAYRRPR
jgi:hypothetical protein